MRVLIATAGGRGDVAPFTGLAAAIEAAGHSVTVTSNDQYENVVTGCGLEFRPLPGTRDIFEDPWWLQGKRGPASTVTVLRTVAECVRNVHKGIVAVARQVSPDVLALAGLASVGGYNVADGLGLPGMDLLVQPSHPTAEFAPSYVTDRSFGRLGNRVAGVAAAAAMALGTGRGVREIRHELGLPRRGTREAVTGEPNAGRWPVFYGFSPAVVPRPADWPAHCQVTGFWWPLLPVSWSPPADLEEFLDAGPRPVFFGFGDMTPDDPGELIELAVAAGRQAGVRQVIQAGSAGPLPASRPAPGDSIVVGDVPHDWLFPRMAALVHHAGAGTAAAGLRAGVPAVTVPVLADQPFWAARLAALGAATRPIPRKQVSAAAVAAAIRDVLADPSYRTKAEALSGRLASEDSAGPVISLLARLGGG